MEFNLLDRDSLVNVCKNTINNIENHDEYTEEDKMFIKAANEYMISVLSQCNTITVKIPQ